jgi:uncharacterized protein (TIGR02246 family)
MMATALWNFSPVDIPCFNLAELRDRCLDYKENRMKSFGRCLILLLVALSVPACGAGRDQDEAEIRDLQERQQDAWNRHDAKAYADLFTEDGEVVNVVGWWWKGRAEIDRKLAEAYKFVFRESRLSIDEIHVRFLTHEIAVAHVLWSISGAKTPPGIPEPRKGIQIQVLQKRDGKWLIASFQNTNSLLEVAFPSGPPDSSSR